MKNSLPILGGIIGAVLGYLATLLILELVGAGNRADPIMSGLLALFVFGPAGAIAGLVIGASLGMRLRGPENAGGLAANSFKAFAVVVVVVAAAGTAYYFYALATATPWLNPNAANPLLQFEVRLPAGTASLTSPRDIAIELQTADRSKHHAGRTQVRPVPARRRPAGDRRQRRARFSYRPSPAGDQDQRPARSRVSHRTFRQGAAHIRTWAVAAATWWQ
jgi:hypothetical protein